MSELGRGKFGVVRLGRPLANLQQRFAIKSIKRKLIIQDIELLETEIGILLEVDHPNIIKFYEVYMD